MQSLKYREILYAVAHKLGYDPLDPNFPRDEAQAIGTYIDQWVTRLYPAHDWPEWTRVKRFLPDANHIVQWTQVSPDTAVPPSVVLSPLTMWRILAVYIVDPRLVYGANSTKFYLREEGIHCGFEHGVDVWIKYIDPPPRFTSVEWTPQTVYQKGDVAYSITTGEVYKSKSNNNLNHDPSAGAFIGGGQGTGGGGSTFVATEVLQEKSISQFGVMEQDKIMKVFVNQLAVPSPAPISDPPPANSSFRITVLDSTGVQLASAFTVANGIITLSGVAADQASQLTTALGAGWTITPGTDASVTIQNASDFQVANIPNGTDWPVYYASLVANAQPLQYMQIQAYIAAVTNAVVTPQIVQTTFSTDQLIAGALYSFTFKDLTGADHVIEYQSQTGDGQDQIIGGILTAIPNTALSDNYFEKVQVSSDSTPSLTFTVDDHASLNALVTLPGSQWWEIVPFPLALAEQVIRGAYADALKDWGQTDKGSMEEQAVSPEADAAAEKFTYAATLPLTGQATTKSRYKT
jgi:hypothetical protein